MDVVYEIPWRHSRGLCGNYHQRPGDQPKSRHLSPASRLYFNNGEKSLNQFCTAFGLERHWNIIVMPLTLVRFLWYT
jgi:hypothetical protein